MTRISILSLIPLFSFLTSCGGSTGSCVVNAAVSPATATADHSAAPPGNQAQFSLVSSVKGNCPLIPDTLGVWSSSNPNVAINSQGLATCQNSVTSAVATISNSGTVRGQPYKSATLTCK